MGVGGGGEHRVGIGGPQDGSRGGGGNTGWE